MIVHTINALHESGEIRLAADDDCYCGNDVEKDSRLLAQPRLSEV